MMRDLSTSDSGCAAANCVSLDATANDADWLEAKDASWLVSIIGLSALPAGVGAAVCTAAGVLICGGFMPATVRAVEEAERKGLRADFRNYTILKIYAE